MTNFNETKSFWSRWLVATGIALLNLAGQMSLLTFTPIVYQTAAFLNVSTKKIITLSSIGFPIMFLMGFIAMCKIDKFGIYYPVVISAWIQSIGTIVRCVGVDTKNYYVLLSGQVLTYIGTPFANLCTSKVACLWFNQEQTAFANALMSLAIPLGFLLAAVLGTLIVGDSGAITDGSFQKLTIICLLISVLGSLLVTIFLKYPHGKKHDSKGVPILPPSLAALKIQMGFWRSCKKLIMNKYYWIHFIPSSISIGYFLVMAVNTSVILCPLGFSKNFSTLYSIGIEIGSGLTFSGVPVVTRSGFLVSIDTRIDFLDLMGPLRGPATGPGLAGPRLAAALLKLLYRVYT